MRLVRLRLRDFRGTVDREVQFAAGVTVVEGPNEIGKSTLAEALQLLLDHDVKSDSRKQSVERVRPIGRDAVPEVEAELDAPPYRFVYRKRFSPRKKDGGGTELQILAPRAEQLAGDDAIDRVRALLAETLDGDLFRALQVEQGRAVGQAMLEGRGWLGDALDRASGGDAAAGGRHETLFDRVRTEALRYHTEKTGAETRLLADLRKATGDADARTDSLRDRLRKLDSAIADHARLVAERRTVQATQPALEAENRQRRDDVRRLETIERRAVETEARAARTAERRRELDAGRQRRADAASQIVELASRQHDARHRLAVLARTADERRGDCDAARAAVRDARAVRETAVARQRACAADVERLHHAAHLVELHRRRDDATRLLARLEELRRDAGRGVDDAAMADLDQLSARLDAARSMLDREGPRLAVDALADIDVVIDGAPRALTAGESLDTADAERLELVVPGRLQIRFDAGEGAAPMRRELEETAATLRERLAVLGVPSVEAARSRAREAQRARAQIEAVMERLDDASGQLDTGERGVIVALTAAIEDDEREIARLRALRPDDLPEPADEGAARAALDRAQASEAEANAAEGRAHEHAERIRDELARADHDRASVESDVHAIDDQLARERARLEAEREQQDDAALEAELGTIAALGAQLDVEASQLRSQLEDADLDARRALADSGAQSVERNRERLQQLEVELRGRTDVLRHEEGEGLAEQLEAAEADVEQSNHELAVALRRGAAARLLFETLSAHRDAARRSYVRPLEERIERLGRVVFGDTFRIELSDDLRIVSSTQDGVTVPFEDRSVGTREQLDLLLRIAAALLVDQHGGVPLILDDTLGNADLERLRAMNALLALAGERLQIIVLTCHPERFAGVGDATLVRLP